MSVPIIGQPFEVKNWFMVVNLECHRCNAHSLVTCLGLFVTICPSCGTRFQFLSFDFHGTKINPAELGLTVGTGIEALQPKPGEGNGGES